MSAPRRALLAALLAGCARAADPPIEVVPLPRSAYGPFGAPAASAGAARDAGEDARAAAESFVECFIPSEALGDDEPAGDPPFDNCPLRHEGGRFDAKTTSRRRARNPDACCYSVVRHERRPAAQPAF